MKDKAEKTPETPSGENLPAETTSAAPVVAGNRNFALSSDLHVRGNEIYLPQTQPVDPDSDEYLELFSGALSHDVAAEVKPALLQSRARYSLFTVMLCVTFLVVTAFLVYDNLPRPRIKTLTTEIVRGDEANPFTMDRTFRKDYEEAHKLVQKEEFDSAVSKLEPTVQELAEDKQSVKDNRELFYLYFSAAQKSLAAYPNAEALIAKVQERDPDSAVWRLFKLWFGAPECRFFGYRSIGEEPNLKRAAELRTLLAETEPAAVSATHDNQDVMLEFYRAQLLYAIWLYQGKLEHDKNDPGVAEREAAYKLTSAHLDSANFLELRRDIAEKTLDSLPWDEGYYYFDGAERWRNDVLKGAIEEATERLKGLKAIQ